MNDQIDPIILHLFEKALATSLPQKYEGVGSYLRESYKDIFLIPLVYDYYQSGEEDFLLFAEQHIPKMEISYPVLAELWQQHKAHVAYLIAFHEEYHERIDDIKIGGDLHPGMTTKLILQKNWHRQINFCNIFFSEDRLRDIREELDPDVANNFSTFVREGNYLTRAYQEVRQLVTDTGQVGQYYYEMGKLMALVVTMRGIDVSYDNILAQFPHPMVFDYECLFVPDLYSDEKYDVRFTGMVDGMSDQNASALFANYSKMESYLSPTVSLSSGQPIIVRTRERQDATMHLLYEIGSDQPLTPLIYREDILSGFQAMSQTIVLKKDLLRQRIDEYVISMRILLRPTRIYVMLLREISYLVLQKNRAEIMSYLRESLENLPLLTFVDTRDVLIDDEISCIMQWIIPTYYGPINGVAIFTPWGQEVARLLHGSYDVFLSHYENIAEVLEDNYEKLKTILYESDMAHKLESLVPQSSL